MRRRYRDAKARPVRFDRGALSDKDSRARSATLGREIVHAGELAQSRVEKLVGSANLSLSAFASIHALATVTTRSFASALVRKTSRSRNRCEPVRVPSSAMIATLARY